MHDFFVDRILDVRSVRAFAKALTAKAREGGGGMRGYEQHDTAGGNAVNLAHALATLGLRTLLVTHSDAPHERMLLDPFRELDAEVRVKPLRPGLTVAVEAEKNVMVGDVGGAGEFGPELLTDDDWGAVARSSVVCVVNWSANRRGTDLLLAARERVGRQSRMFFDPADFRERTREFGELLAMIRKSRLADWISLNEYECIEAARILKSSSMDPERACAVIARSLGAAVDVHTERRAFSSDGVQTSEAVTEPVIPRRLTGAGDVWNAASIYCRLNGIAGSERLDFANTAARLYLQAPAPSPPRLAEVNRELG